MPELITVWWNGSGYTVFGTEMTAAKVLVRLLEGHVDLRPMDLGLFTMGGIELRPGDSIRHGEELILRPRVVH